MTVLAVSMIAEAVPRKATSKNQDLARGLARGDIYIRGYILFYGLLLLRHSHIFARSKKRR
jgi:hypothetical protein